MPQVIRIKNAHAQNIRSYNGFEHHKTKRDCLNYDLSGDSDFEQDNMSKAKRKSRILTGNAEGLKRH